MASRLQLLTIPEPCSAPWDEMAGGDVRRCARCDTDVHDLDALGETAAEALLATPGRLCVRKRLTAVWRRPSPARRAAAVGLLAALLAGCATTKPQTVAVAHPEPVVVPEQVTAEEAREILRGLGWSNEEINAEAIAHEARRVEADYEAPPDGTAEADLHRMLAVIAEEMVVDDSRIETDRVYHQRTVLGRRN